MKKEVIFLAFSLIVVFITGSVLSQGFTEDEINAFLNNNESVSEFTEDEINAFLNDNENKDNKLITSPGIFQKNKLIILVIASIITVLIVFIILLLRKLRQPQYKHPHNI
ncbi:hypothetical protein HYT25_01400 [Candidatus Pacearchaeota archaeon]|nr:hypothetical protein [Candidatus Pacearchaeota archaeon]